MRKIDRTAPIRSRLVALKESARGLGVPYTSWRDVVLRDFAFVRLGTHIYVEQADIDRWVEGHKERAGVGR